MQQPKQKKASESKNPLNELFFKFLPYWPLFVITVMIGLFCAWFYLRTAIPKYEASASIMLKDETKGADNGKSLNQLDQLSDKKIIENELQVLLSRTLMYNVVKKLHAYASFYEEGELGPIPAYITSPITLEAADPDNLKKVKKVEYSFNEKDSQVVIGGVKYPLDQFVNTPYGNLKFVKNKRFSYKPSKQLYFTLASPRSVSGGFSGGLKAIAGRESTVVSLSIKDDVPERAEDLLNELILAYDEAATAEKNRIAYNSAKFVEERLDSVQKELNIINLRKQSYKSSQSAVNISSQGELFLKSVNENDQKVNDVDIQLSMLNQVKKYVESKDQTAALAPSTIGIKDPFLNKMLGDLYESQQNYEKLKKSSGENNPMVATIKDKIEKIRPDLLENIDNQKQSLEASKLNLHAANNQYISLLQSIPQKEKDLIDIDREQAIKFGIYNFLSQKRDEIKLAMVSNIEGARVVDRALANYFPVSPNPKMIYIIAFVLAIGIPAAFIFAKEMLNRKILFRSEIEKMTSTPIIGEIILDKSKDPIVIQEGKRTFVAEQFRRIRTSLGFLGLGGPKKRILITSSLSGEGKSFVATNLSLSLAMAGKKVVLIEFDLANPSLSKKLQVHYETGASSYLSGECEPEDVIRRTSVHENLFFIPSGPLPENPSELLMSHRVKELLSYLDAAFDIIIIDSAPASLLSDAYVLSPLCDATLYVVKHKFTPKIYIDRLDESNSVTQLKNLGIIFNGIQSRGFTKNGYGYGYGYGYIYNNNYGKKTRKTRQ